VVTQKTHIVQQVDVPSALLIKREDNIIHIHIKLDMELGVEHIDEIYDARMQLSGRVKHPVLFTSTKFVVPSNEVREYLSTKKRNDYVSAEAIVIRSLPQRLITNFYIKFNKPTRPTKMFTDKNKAIEWLSKFL